MSEGHPLESVLPSVEKPGRYVGGEWNQIRKNPAAVEIRVALVYPDVYEIGMSYLGQKILYSVLNKTKSVLAERVFAPWPDFENTLRRSGLRLVSLENGIPLVDFDILGFSLLYELNYSNILTILDLGGVPLYSSERELRHPLVIAGGPAAFNPEPTAEIFDAFFLGDGEEGFPEILEAYRRLKRSGLDREGILHELARVPGVYVPSRYKAVKVPSSSLLVPEPIEGAPLRVHKRILKDIGDSQFPEDIIVPSIRVVFDRVAMESARGCPQNCRFCQASTLYFPHRPRNPDVVVESVVKSLLRTGYGDCSLSALSIGDYPHLEETVRRLMDELSPEKISLSLSSLRPGTLSREIVENILRVRKTGFTLVPEAGTERLRRVINKKLSDGEIFEALTHAFREGWALVKFYFMIGLPTETDEDLKGIVSLVRKSWELGRSLLHAPPRIHVSLSSFIPKPHTPFQWLGMEDENTLEDKKRFLRAELKKFRGVEIKDHPVKTSVLEAVFSRGDRRLNRVLRKAWEKGARFDSWGDCFDFSRWADAFTEEEVAYHDYLKPLDAGAPLPWEPVDPGFRKAHFLRELQAAMRGEETPGCLEKKCADCEGCEIRSWKRSKKKGRIRAHPYAVQWLGAMSEETVRYRAVYEKKGRARFLSHIDLIQVLQRAFRRAGIAVRQTQGFHPKPDFSYGPALPLGMEGLKEVLEFRSPRHFGEKEFLARINRALPSGYRFRSLARLGQSDRPLSSTMTAFVYSMGLKEAATGGRGPSSPADKAGTRKGGISVEVRRILDEYRKKHGDAPFDYTIKGRRLLLSFPLSQGRPPRRPQDIVSEVFGLDNPSFFLRREEIVFD